MFLSQVADAEGCGPTDAQLDELLFGIQYETVHKSDYAVVLGTAPAYAAVRAEIAAEFYRRGGAKKIVVSGAAVSDAKQTEAAFLRGELIGRGVPDETIIQEPNAYDTIQNMTCSLTEICKRTDVMNVESITIVIEPFHMRRALCLARLLLPDFICVHGYTSGTNAQRDAWKTDPRLRECVRTETIILRQLIMRGRIRDIEISEKS